jgi:FkbH-like protein
MKIELAWLPESQGWDDALEGVRDNNNSDIEKWNALVSLANFNINFIQTGKLDRSAQRIFSDGLPGTLEVKSIRLALLGSSTLRHLVPGIRVAGLRRGMWIEVYEAEYGQYRQELIDPDSELHTFHPDCVCIALDAYHLAEASDLDIKLTLAMLRECWRMAKQAFGCTVIQQTALPVFPDLMGNNEHRLPDSPKTFVCQFNIALEAAADQEEVHLLAVDQHAAVHGIQEWHDAALWHRAKHEIHPRASHLYGDQLVRILAAQRGRSYKCLVLDLDNTIWGGVIGDDGLQNIVLGHGSAAGEAYVAFQRYVQRLSKRGIILAVCTKNDEDSALSPFEKHPEMVLRRNDIACFVANWQDKALNLRHIAKALNIGIDSLVFVDDNPFERNLVRRELPQVAVPELPQDPALYAACISEAGYFEGLSFTDEDRDRSFQYQAKAHRESFLQTTTDMAGYLEGLKMELSWTPFDQVGLRRIVQLINKTNQFNLTTRRYTEAQVAALMEDRKVLTYQMRLKDRFGDNGIIAILIAKLNAEGELVVDTWLMSCRVLGRQVEESSLNLLVEGAKSLGVPRIIGEFVPTGRNKMVEALYRNLGFCHLNTATDGRSTWSLDVKLYLAKETKIRVLEFAGAGS